MRSIVSGVEDREPSFDDLANLIHSYFKEAEGKRQSRPRTLLVSALRNVFTEGLLPRNFELFEFDDPIVSSKKNNLSKPFSIQNTVYIDTPMSIGLNQTDVQHWDDLNRLVLAKGTRSNDFILNVISKDIIFGDADINDSSRSSIGYTFKRNDGNAFNLLDCATGIKAFAIIQLLLRNGTINEKTLLIIDEPEVHLHPQWIVEYARIIVLLNKKMGVKFFITSHDPDFVSAIRYLSEKEGILESVNFYLAEKTENTFTYKYRNLGHEIDPIFQSFNQAIDKIDKYSE
ncbi:MAG: ATP-binding protein [Chitinophagaceae bacterium]|nr:ATP-binding protein [Chitinophagaceae bacterium]